MRTNRTYPIDALVSGLEEQRVDLGLSRAALAALAGTTAQTVYNVERGKSRNPQTALRLRTALAIVELYGSRPQPEPTFVDELAARLLGVTA